MDRSDAFTSIYSRGAWGEGTSASGPGSDPEISRPYVDLVQALIASEGIASVVDLGHGDWQMWPSEAFSDVDYQGFDVARGLSEAVTLQFGTANRRFEFGDCVTMRIPRAQLVLCKDVFMHLPDDDVSQVLRKLSGFPWVVICQDVLPPARRLSQKMEQLRAQLALRYRLRDLTHGRINLRRFMVQNSSIEPGGYRPLDLSSAPWNLNAFGLTVVSVRDIPSNNAWPGVVKRIWVMRGQEVASAS